ncbi:hypothetical protein INP83_12610 [Mucilaginibacter sp. 21P]|nr:hypothetical protein INP83_12610 [Mucilaginibacter sp. 21P]
MKLRKVNTICIAILLAWAFLAGQITVSFHHHHPVKQERASKDHSGPEKSRCSICQFNFHPPLPAASACQTVILDVKHYSYLVSNLAVSYHTTVHILCGRAPPVSA